MMNVNNPESVNSQFQLHVYCMQASRDPTVSAVKNEYKVIYLKLMDMPNYLPVLGL